MKSKGEMWAMWAVPTEKNLKQRIAGYLSHQTRLVNLARTRSQKNAIISAYQAKIDDVIEEHQHTAISAKRHNAAVKAAMTRNLEACFGQSPAPTGVRRVQAVCVCRKKR